MDNVEVDFDGSQLKVMGIQDATKLVALRGSIAQKLSELSLHKEDLMFSYRCLDELINEQLSSTTRRSLWLSAITFYTKCFDKTVKRKSLPEEEIFRHESPTAILVHNHFKTLRNKHLIHDENPLSQSTPAAALNDGTKSYKIEKIICLNTFGETYSKESHTNLSLLIQLAIKNVTFNFNKLCDELTIELEKESYQSLSSRNEPTYTVPTTAEFTQKKNNHL
ncbi:hypothetical protein [Pseudomonas sp. ES3]|uniref:hypothetical protein n=1 Tax=Pseudomonas sp. ES3 TaxID=3424776 RepID=UPI003D3382BF